MAKYGSAAEPLPDEVKVLAGSERYVEYDRSGRVIKGVEVKAKSRYDEDVLINNHTCVWGSWWRDGADDTHTSFSVGASVALDAASSFVELRELGGHVGGESLVSWHFSQSTGDLSKRLGPTSG